MLRRASSSGTFVNFTVASPLTFGLATTPTSACSAMMRITSSIGVLRKSTLIFFCSRSRSGANPGSEPPSFALGLGLAGAGFCTWGGFPNPVRWVWEPGPVPSICLGGRGAGVTGSPPEAEAPRMDQVIQRAVASFQSFPGGPNFSNCLAVEDLIIASPEDRSGFPNAIHCAWGPLVPVGPVASLRLDRSRVLIC